MQVAPLKNTSPKLRFKEFELNPIRAKKMSDFGSFYYGKSAPKHSLSDDAPTPCVRYGELYSKFGENISKIHSFTNIDPKNLKFSIGGEVLIPRVGEDPLDFGNASYLPIPNVAIGEMISVFNTNENGLFFTYYINGKLRKAFAKVVEGGSVSNLYFRYLEKIVVSIPTLPEQKKIASFLSSVDNRIQKLERKKSLLAAYKKGVMRQLFSQELRFKDDNGNNYPDWEEKKLWQVMSERNTKAPKSDKFPLMSFIARKGVAPKGERYNRGFLVNDEDNKKYKQTEYGDFIYSSNNLETGSIGLNRYGSASISPVYSIFQIGNSCNYKFISSYLIRKLFIYKMIRFRQGVVYGQWRIHESEFLKIKEFFPSLKEQQKIASFLSGLDKKIELVETQIQQSKTFKKGLLQQLFV